MNASKWRVRCIVLMVVGCLVMPVSVNLPGNALFVGAILGFVLFIGGIILQFIFWRCRHCNTHLPPNCGPGTEFCPYCGKRLE